MGNVCRDILLIFVSLLPCVAIWALARNGIALQETPRRILQGMVENERVLVTASDLTSELQSERALGAMNAVTPSDLPASNVWRSQLQKTDNALTAFQQAIFDAKLHADRTAVAFVATTKLKDIRKETEKALPKEWRKSFAAYSDVIDAVLGVSQATKMAKTDRGIGKLFVRIVLIQDSQEAASRLQTFLDVHQRIGDSFTSDDVLEVAKQWAATSEFLDTPLSGLEPRSKELLTQLHKSQEWVSLRNIATNIITGRSDAQAEQRSALSIASANTVAAGILDIERTESEAVQNQLEAYDTSDRSRQTSIYSWMTFATVAQILVVFFCGSSILIRRRLSRVNALLAEQRSDLNTTLRSIQEAAIATDNDGRITRMNPMAETLTGWAVVEALGRPIDHVFRRFDPKTRAPILSSVDESSASNRGLPSSPAHMLLVSRNGDEYHIADNAAAIVTAEGVARGTIHVFRNISLEWETHQKLLESESLHRCLMDNLPAGVMIVDPKTRIVENINPYAAALVGLSKSEIVGKRCHAFLCPTQKGACPICDLHQTIDNSERVMLRANGTRVPILKSVKRIQIANQEKLLECFVNLTAYRQIEDDLRRTKQDLEQHAIALRFASQALEKNIPITDATFSI
jgi:PAS domain S-box-containing protein